MKAFNSHGRPVVESLGKVVAREQDDELERNGTVAKAAAGYRPPSMERRVNPSRLWLKLVVVAALLALLAALGWFFLHARPIRITTPGVEVGGFEGRDDSEQPIEFSDGSTLLLRAGARSRITALGETGAQVIIERGSAAVGVRHSTKTRWEFHAGPFDVVVTGTRFDLDWQPASQRLDLVMQDGAVRVSGPGLTEPRQLVAGERVSLFVGPPPQPSNPPAPPTPKPSEPTPEK